MKRNYQNNDTHSDHLNMAENEDTVCEMNELHQTKSMTQNRCNPNQTPHRKNEKNDFIDV